MGLLVISRVAQQMFFVLGTEQRRLSTLQSKATTQVLLLGLHRMAEELPG